MNTEIQEMTVTTFQFILILIACFCFVLAAVDKNKEDLLRFRLVSAGLACWILFILLQLLHEVLK